MTILSDDAFVRLFQKSAGLKEDGWAGPDTIAALRKLVPPPAEPAPGSAIPDAYLAML
jgi:peptidoglycan hydrolase-like protein with peptidoglycan-binding domain